MLTIARSKQFITVLPAIIRYFFTVFLIAGFSLLATPVMSSEQIIESEITVFETLTNNDQRFLPRQVIITLTPPRNQFSQHIKWLTEQFYYRTNNTLTYLRPLSLSGRYLFTVKGSQNNEEMARLIKNLRSLLGVNKVEEDIILRYTSLPNDSFINQQWPLFDNTGGIDADIAWQHSTGLGAVVAVLDTGYTDHTEFTGQLNPGYDFIKDSAMANDGNGRDNDPHDPGDWLEAWECGFLNPSSFVPSSWHGTHVTGTIVAKANNNLGVAGVAFNSKVIPVRVLGKCGGRLSDIVDAIIWASGGHVSGVPDISQPADIISMSLGSSGSCSSSFQFAINQALANGSSVIASAGNNGQNAANHQPSNCDGVIAVAASDLQGNLAYYSNYGAVTLTAPGGALNVSSTGGVLSTLNTGRREPISPAYSYYQGTSMAVPHVAGVAALLYQLDPGLTPLALSQLLTDTATVPPGNCNGCGAGIVNAAAAVAALQSPDIVNERPIADFSTNANGRQVAFTDLSTDGDGIVFSWWWDFGDGNNSAAQHPSHTYLIDGNYQVSLTIKDDDGASGQVIKMITVLSAVNIPPSADFSYQLDDLVVNFTDNSSDSDGSVVLWHWDFGDNTESERQNPQHQYNEPGEYQVTLTVTDDREATGLVGHSVTILPPTTTITLSHTWAKLYTSGRFRVRLVWSGAQGAQVDIYYNSQKVATTRNDGRYTHRQSNVTDNVAFFKLCQAATSRCSSEYKVVFE